MKGIGWWGMSLWVLVMLPSLVFGGDLDGSKPAVCAIMETFQCAPGEDCIRGNAESVGLPYFFQVNFQEKKILAAREGKEETTKIERIERQGGMWILQGVELRGWTITVLETTGKMVLSAAGDAEGFVLFGACTMK
jgi:hypothetical protein